ncbi:MAG: hypothetical protein GKS00_20620 [Alphaproteobacteria bacterium]|nr:hypothetical protein [Alphaproteobacteria bacterium]
MRREAKNTEPVWTAIRDRLEAKRKETFEALRNYPRQVAGCDTHYQHLAERRAKISGELRQLEALRRDNPAEGIEKFLRESAFIDETVVPGR